MNNSNLEKRWSSKLITKNFIEAFLRHFIFLGKKNLLRRKNDDFMTTLIYIWWHDTTTTSTAFFYRSPALCRSLLFLLFCFYFYVDDVQIKSTDVEKLSMGQQWHRLVGASLSFVPSHTNTFFCISNAISRSRNCLWKLFYCRFLIKYFSPLLLLN